MYRIRFLKLMVRALLTKPTSLFGEFSLHFRVIPLLDTDFSRLFTQTYSSFMALARWHYVFTSEFKRAALKNGLVPVTTSECITYHRSIKSLHWVELKTKMICWNDSRFYLEQTFWVRGEKFAEALVEGLLRGPGGAVNPIKAFQLMGVHQDSPPVPLKFQNWIATLKT